MRKIAQFFSSIFFVRYTVLFFIRIQSLFVRVLSNLKFKALVKNSGDSLCHYTTEIKHGENITIGNYCRIGKYSSLGAMSPITIGNNVALSRGVILETGGLDFSTQLPYKHISKPIVIEDGVWLGTNVMVLGGVTIGKNAIIGAGAVITKNVNESEIIVGAKNRVL
mgnify:CR=1 FL=1